jgi:hypothetical protein
MNWKGYGRKRSQPTLSDYPDIYWMDWGEPQKTLLKIPGLHIEISTTEILDVKQTNHLTMAISIYLVEKKRDLDYKNSWHAESNLHMN